MLIRNIIIHKNGLKIFKKVIDEKSGNAIENYFLKICSKG